MSSIRRFSASFVVLLCLLFSHPTLAPAQDFDDPRGRASESTSDPRERVSDSDTAWSSAWKSPDWTDALWTAGLFAGGSAIQFGIGAPEAPRWIGPVLADGFMRNSLLAETDDGLSLTGQASDVLLFSLVGAPLLLEPALAWLGHGDTETAGKLALINAQALGATFFATTALKHTVGRQRPPIGACWDDPNANDSCDERDTLSFPSGHTSMAFAGAGLLCLNHEMLQPLGGGWADKAVCYTALSAATATGIFRMTANKHYLTDVLAGAALGLAGGYLLPKWLYFGFGGDDGDDSDGVLSDSGAVISPSVGEVNGVNFSLTW